MKKVDLVRQESDQHNRLGQKNGENNEQPWTKVSRCRNQEN